MFGVSPHRVFNPISSPSILKILRRLLYPDDAVKQDLKFAIELELWLHIWLHFHILSLSYSNQCHCKCKPFSIRRDQRRFLSTLSFVYLFRFPMRILSVYLVAKTLHLANEPCFSSEKKRVSQLKSFKYGVDVPPVAVLFYSQIFSSFPVNYIK